MEIVPIPPTSLIAHAAGICKYQFALVHECERYGAHSEYVRQYQKIGSSPDHYLILDNGAFELGSSMPLDRIIEWMDILCPNEVVLPDRMFMADETIRMSLEALRQLRLTRLTDSSGRKYTPAFQGVVHGRNHKEWLDCAHAMFDMGVDVLAIPKDYEAWSGGREVLLEMVQRIGLPVHLIGMEKDYFEFLNWRCTELVRSMDTAKPYIMAYNHTRWFHGEVYVYGSRVAFKHPRPQNYFDLNFDTYQKACAKENLEAWNTAYNYL